MQPLCYDLACVNTWNMILAGIGVAMILEGLPYFVSPSGVRSYLARILTMPDATIRTVGFLLMAGGLVVAYLAIC